jgi:hypothetical protein
MTPCLQELVDQCKRTRQRSSVAAVHQVHQHVLRFFKRYRLIDKSMSNELKKQQVLVKALLHAERKLAIQEENLRLQHMMQTG